MDTPRETMDKVIPKKNRPSEKTYRIYCYRVSNSRADLYGFLCRSYLNIQS